MDRVFKSKVDWWFHLLIIIMVILCVLTFLQRNMFIMAVMLMATFFAIHILLNTYYVITDTGMLLLRCGIFPKKEIAIKDIEALERSILPVFSYSLSLDRIVVWKEGKMWMMVSPQNEKDFIKLLLKHNPGIKILKDTNMLDL